MSGRAAVAVPRLWPGETVAILGGGPSLSQAQVDQVLAARIPVIAIKDAVRLAPAAPVLYACDEKWWRHYGPALGPEREGQLRYALQAGAFPWACALRNTGELGLELDPSGLRTGKNSGYQAINLAVHLGARRVVLLGYDMQPDRGPRGLRHHWFGAHPYRTAEPPYAAFLQCFASLPGPLRAAGVEVLNATPGSALACFPRVALAEALEAAA